MKKPYIDRQGTIHFGKITSPSLDGLGGGGSADWASSGYDVDVPLVWNLNDNGTISTDYIFVGGCAVVSIYADWIDYTLNEYDAEKALIASRDNIHTISLYSIKQGTRYITIVGKTRNVNDGDKVKLVIRPINTMLNNRRLMSNPNIPCFAHQGIGLGDNDMGGNLLSSVYGAYLYGFDGMLCNIAWTSDNVPICEHDGSIGGLVITQHTYDEIAEISRTESGEPTARLEDVVKLAKMLGMKLFFVNNTANATKWNIIRRILQRYQMQDMVTWMSTYSGAFIGDSSAITKVLEWNPNAKIAICQESIGSTDYSQIEQNITKAETILASYPNAVIYLWSNNAHDVQHFIDANLALFTKPRIRLAMYHNDQKLTDAQMLERMPYVSFYSHHSKSFGQMNYDVLQKLAEEFPQIVSRKYGKLI